MLFSLNCGIIIFTAYHFGRTFILIIESEAKMNISQKIISFFSAAVLIFFLLPLPQGIETDAAGSYYYYYQDKQKYSKAEKYIAEQLYSCADVIDVSEYKLTLSDFDKVMTDILLSRPDIFYIEPEYSYTKYRNSDYINTFTPGYYYAKSTISRRREELSSESDRLLSGLSDSWSDAQKALYIHDKLALTMEYDENNEIRSAYEGIITKKALCVSYAMAYKYLMDKAGIKCICVTSTEMAHCWNMAEIDGEWYHIDVTWDDLLPDFQGMVSHDLFMLSDSKITTLKNMPHSDWDYGYNAENTLYDNMFWSRSEGQIIPVSDNVWYYVDSYRGKLCRYSWSGNRSQDVADIGKNWSDGKGGIYNYCFSRLEYSDNKLFFNTNDTISSFDLRGKETAAEKKIIADSGEIYGIIISDGIMKYETASSPLDYNSKTHDAFPIRQETYLNAPESFRGVASKNGSKYNIAFSWDKVSGADGYIIYRYDTSSKKAVKIYDTKKTSFTLTGVSKGTHSYIVCAYKLINGQMIKGDFSSTVTKNLK